MPYIYLGSPYTHEDKSVEEARYAAVLAYTAELFRQRKWVYSPIVHCHHLTVVHTIPGDIDYWREYDEAMIGPAAEVHFLQLPDWDLSKGVAFEADTARELNKPITWVPFSAVVDLIHVSTLRKLAG